MSKVVVITRDVVGQNMAGPAIRYVTLSKYLSNKEHQVTLMAANKPDISSDEFEIVEYSTKSLLTRLRTADVVISQGFPTLAFLLSFFPKVKFIADLYAPSSLEFLETGKVMPMFKRIYRQERLRKITNILMFAADFIICANERQRDLYIGYLFSLGLVNPDQYDHDNYLKKYLEIVPFGVRDELPQKTANVIKGVIKGIDENDKVLIWNGGIYNWYDAETLIKAMKIVVGKRKNIKLLFPGTKHPNPMVKEDEKLAGVIELSKKFNLYDKYVFFNFGWVPFEKTKEYLTEADIGVSTYYNHLETRYSFRTRFLDHLWACKPIIATRGDAISDLIDKEKLGIAVNEKNEHELAQAILKLAEDDRFYAQCVENIKNIRGGMVWHTILQPIEKFIVSHDPSNNHRRSTTYFLMMLELVFSWLSNRIFRLVTLKV